MYKEPQLSALDGLHGQLLLGWQGVQSCHAVQRDPQQVPLCTAGQKWWHSPAGHDIQALAAP